MGEIQDTANKVATNRTYRPVPVSPAPLAVPHQTLRWVWLSLNVAHTCGTSPPCCGSVSGCSRGTGCRPSAVAPAAPGPARAGSPGPSRAGRSSRAPPRACRGRTGAGRTGRRSTARGSTDCPCAENSPRGRVRERLVTACRYALCSTTCDFVYACMNDHCKLCIFN